MKRPPLALVAWLAALSLLPATAAVGSNVSVRSVGSSVNGTLKLSPFSPQTACRFSPFVLTKQSGPLRAGTKTLLAQCSAKGTFAGSPKKGAAGYGWNWYLQVGSDGKTTGLAAEYGVVTVPTPAGPARLLTIGVQKPVGPQTSQHAKGLSTGTWKATGGLSAKGTATSPGLMGSQLYSTFAMALWLRVSRTRTRPISP